MKPGKGNSWNRKVMILNIMDDDFVFSWKENCSGQNHLRRIKLIRDPYCTACSTASIADESQDIQWHFPSLCFINSLEFPLFFPIYSRQVRRLIIKKKAWKVKKSKTITINQHHDKQWKSKLSHHLPPFQAVSLLLFFFLFCFPKKKPRKHCMNAYVVYPHNFIITSPIVKRKKKGGGRH